MGVILCVSRGKCITTREFYRVCLYNARGVYECFKCGRPIMKGELYVYEYIHGGVRHYHLKCYDNPHVKVVRTELEGIFLCREK